ASRRPCGTWHFSTDDGTDQDDNRGFSLTIKRNILILWLFWNGKLNESNGKSKAVLAEVVGQRGTPVHLRSDNGPEFIAAALRSWLAEAGVETLYIEPGSPWENGYAESFNSKVRDEFLAVEEFTSLLEAQV